MLQMTTATTATSGATAWATAASRGATFTAQASRMRLATDTAERRRGLRVAQLRPVKMLDMAAGRTVAGQTLDVSATGLRVELPAGTGLRIGSVLGIHVGLSRIGERLANRRQMIPVRVVWIDHDAGRPGHLVAGVEFATGISSQRDAA